MKQKKMCFHQEPEIQNKDSNTSSHLIKNIKAINACWPAYAYHTVFIPGTDLTFAFDALKEAVKKWLIPSNKNKNHLKNNEKI
ncbi:hypothetical protein [Chryseobacterium sp. ON_d1]|uniref:hypothetical protein n=1 Tax=Chryseobacterium sp. ON_d1 TaxID=2583211 RepID=UPI00115C3099|nr:hypothetical protein [Chryseobacterium sp. ON_d1]GEJ43497.1 hypothetical protein CRS_01050 [Chryseobacterium sp. ON_d1]